MGKASRDKGLRRERALVEIHKQSGIAAERVPLSGATRYRGNGADIDIYARGQSEPPLIAEVKARGDRDLAAQALRARQRARLARAAAGFLAARPGLAGLEARFDAMVFGAWPWPRHVVDAWRDSP